MLKLLAENVNQEDILVITVAVCLCRRIPAGPGAGAQG